MRLNHKRLALLGAHVARGVAKLVRLTPARLDFVTHLMKGALCQRDLADRLCVSAPVISRMVRALMRLGFVKRVIPVADTRFRIVSLTQFGRDEYMRLTACEWLMHEDVRYDAQSLGEGVWQQDWSAVLDRIGLAFLAEIWEHDYHGEQLADPPYGAMRIHHRAGVYRDPVMRADDAHFDLGFWPLDVKILAPPLELGVVPDPLSEAYAAAWEPPREQAA